MSGEATQNGQGSTARKHDVPLAIIGISCLFPGADGLDAYWHNIKNGVDSITDIPSTHWSPTDYFNPDPKAPDRTYATRGGFIPEVDFNPLDFGIAPNALEATDTAQLLGIYTARKALIDAGYGDDRPFDRDRVSVLLGVTGTSELTVSLGARLGHPFWRKALSEAGVAGEVAEDVVRRISASYVEWQEASFPGLLGNVVAGRIANRLDLGGTNCVVDAACASSLSAIHLAAMELAEGRCDMAITGGVDTLNDIFMYMCFSKTPALSPTGDARPFDHQGDGTILGEGVGMLVLKRLDDAIRDGDRIYAELRGLGTSSDGKGNAIYAPSSKGQAKALRRTYERAGATPDTVELVEAHGTGTVVGDAAESAALGAVYREARADGTWCALGSVKSQIGHTKAAAGAASLIKAAMALHHKVLPPTIKVAQPLAQVAPGASPFYVNTDKRPWTMPVGHPRRAAVSSFGFGGSNFHCMLQEHVAPGLPGVGASRGAGHDEVDWDGDVQVLAICGRDRDDLAGWLTRAGEAADWNAIRALGQESRAAFQPTAAERLLLVIEKDGVDVADLASRALRQLDQQTAASWSTPEGVYYGRGVADGELAVLFPGQGSQYVGMLRDLACQFPAMRAALDAANGDAANRLSDVIYPHPAFDDATRARQDEDLRDTRHAQPAIGSASVGAFHVLRGFGVAPSATAGHSFGELTALYAVGRISEVDFHALARLRGALMGAEDAGRGAMLAVRSSLADVERLLAEESLELVVANRNGPQQVVLSGAIAEIDRAAEACRSRQITARRLPVSAAFHSPLVADAVTPLAEALRAIEFADGSAPVYANSTAAGYPADAGSARELLAHQLSMPVLFDDLVRQMHHDGVRTFVEVGPHARLTGLVAAILADRPHHSFALDASHGSRSGIRDLGRALAQIGALGHAVDLQPWDASFSPNSLPTSSGRVGVSYRVGGANIRTRKRESMQRHEQRGQEHSAAATAVGVGPTTPVVPHTTPQSGEVANAPNGHAPNGHAANGHAANGHAANGHAANGHAANGHAARERGHDEPWRQVVATPVSTSIAASVAEALRITQENMVALQRLQAQTAQLHHQFLEGQNASQSHYHTLLQQQQRFLDLSLGLPVSASAPASPVAPVAPVPAAPPAPQPISYAPPPASSFAPPPAPAYSPPVPAPSASASAPAAPSAQASAPITEMLIEPAARKDAPPAVENAGPEVADILLEIVAEKTGYPSDVLDLKMELDADLGIDSIKRVEILSALQDALPGTPRVGADQLGTLRTLQSLLDLMPGKPAAPATTVERPVSGADSVMSGAMADDAASAIAIAPPLQRYVLSSTDFDGAGEAPAVRPAKGATIWITDGDLELAAEIGDHLKAAGFAPRVVGSELNGYAGERVAGLVVLPVRDGVTSRHLLGALQVVQGAGKSLRAIGQAGGAFLVTVSRLDGSFGTTGGALVDGMSGGYAGITKSALHEWPEVRCRALDLSADLQVREAAAAIFTELFQIGPVELGLTSSGRRILTLQEGQQAGQPRDASGSLPVKTGDVCVLSGGARGVTAAAAFALAATCKPTLVLLGRSAEPGVEPAWLGALESEAAIKQAVLARGDASTPREAGAMFRKIRADREIRSNLARMRATGATVRYVAADVTDRTALHAALRSVRDELGPIRALIHGAGVLADQHILDKTAESFERVYAPKVRGLLNLLDGVDRSALRALVVFSSTTARFGRAGQVDYAIANEVLNKIAQQEARELRGCQVVSLNWGPWEGGMVDASLAAVFASEGVPLISLAQGADHMLRELAASQREVERVVLGPAVDGDAIAQQLGLAAKVEADAPRRELRFTSLLPLAVEEILSVATAPFLRSHVLDGKAVVPMAMLPEWLAHAAMHGNPGLKFYGVDKLSVLKGVVLDVDETLRLKLHAGPATKDEEGYRVAVELRVSRAGGAEHLHARADILLVDRLPQEKPVLADPEGAAWEKSAAETYRDHLFHGPDFQGIEQLVMCSSEGVIAMSGTAPQPKEWMDRPLRRRWLTDPLALDVGIQLLTFWTGVESAGPSLPCAAARYRQYRAFPKKDIRVVARITRSDVTRVVADIEFTNAAGQLIARFEGCENIIDAGLVRTFRGNRLPAEVSS